MCLVVAVVSCVWGPMVVSIPSPEYSKVFVVLRSGADVFIVVLTLSDGMMFQNSEP